MIEQKFQHWNCWLEQFCSEYEYEMFVCWDECDCCCWILICFPGILQWIKTHTQDSRFYFNGQTEKHFVFVLWVFVCLLFKLSFGYVPSEIIFSSLITKTRLAEGVFAIIFSFGGHKENRMNVNTSKAFSKYVLLLIPSF